MNNQQKSYILPALLLTQTKRYHTIVQATLLLLNSKSSLCNSQAGNEMTQSVIVLLRVLVMLTPNAPSLMDGCCGPWSGGSVIPGDKLGFIITAGSDVEAGGGSSEMGSVSPAPTAAISMITGESKSSSLNTVASSVTTATMLHVRILSWSVCF